MEEHGEWFIKGSSLLLVLISLLVVCFRYPGSERAVLDGMSFKMEAGHHYAFVGKNGAGKTTITKLLKALFSVVYQDFARYYIRLKDNIALGDLHRKGNEMQAAHLAGRRNNYESKRISIKFIC